MESSTGLADTWTSTELHSDSSKMITSMVKLLSGMPRMIKQSLNKESSILKKKDGSLKSI